MSGFWGQFDRLLKRRMRKPGTLACLPLPAGQAGDRQAQRSDLTRDCFASGRFAASRSQ